MTATAIALSAAGTAVAAYGAYQQGQTAKKIANYNAKMSEFAADDAIKRASIAADAQRNRARQILAQQRAVMGASGLESDTGTFGQVLEQTATLGELDARQIEANAQREAWGLRSQASLTRAQGSWDAQSGSLSAFGTLLGGASKAYGIYTSAYPGTAPGARPSPQNRPGSFDPNIYNP
jgi:hypothetical protein